MNLDDLWTELNSLHLSPYRNWLNNTMISVYAKHNLEAILIRYLSGSIPQREVLLMYRLWMISQPADRFAPGVDYDLHEVFSMWKWEP